MTAETRRFTIAGMIFVLVALFCFFCNAILHAQEVTDLPLAASDSPSRPASMTEKVSETIEGIKSGDISAAEQAVAFDKLLSYTLIRIADCWTLCKQEMILASECARQEAVQTAKDIFKKGVDAATEQGREAILDKLPVFVSPEQHDGASGN